ncbi:hypothetical protein [Cryobacterium zhongshanensis]|uniref:DNA-binding protein n=1 Tax=Cryobacterium zhongshanensis TaxID=2928153 RepID=A0AA41QZH8_9MICO|nr:hypothetical protein [Cryobacterium zhongshanensis]MCI4659733.1 hypothetical protein [Cryobacterium zhongshanensis]
MTITAPHPEVQESVQYFLATAQSQGQNDELVISLLRESADLLKKRQPHGGTLSDEQVAFLIESGDFTAEEFAETEASVARGDLAEEERKTRLEAVSASLSAAEVAKKLGIDASSVRHRQSKGSLCAFIAGGKRRYPTWQFTDDPTQPVLPGLAALVRGVPEDMHPASIQGFMSTPQASLLINDERVTPAEWLRLGGDPQALVRILNSILQS